MTTAEQKDSTQNAVQKNDVKQIETKQVAAKQNDAPKNSPVNKSICWSLVSTRRWSNGFAAVQEYRQRWHIENDGNRELKEGWRLGQRVLTLNVE